MSPELLDSVLLQTDFPDLHLHASGKVRDVYSVGDQQLLFVATDRISAFDYILATGIPHKGHVLSQISLFWFDYLADIVPNHLITADVDQYPPAVRKYADQLRGRSMLVQRAEMSSTHRRFASTPTSCADVPCSCSAPKCSRSSASYAATSQVPPGRNTRQPARSRASSFPRA